MGIAILVIFSTGLYQIGKWVWGKFINKPRAIATTEPTQQALPIVSTEPNWDGYEAPTFARRGMPLPVLTAKVKAKRVRKSKAAPTPEVESYQMGNRVLFSKFERDNHATH